MNKNQTLWPPPEHLPNPSHAQRKAMVMYELALRGRLEDYPYIAKSMAPAPDITTIAHPGECKGLTVGVMGGGLAGLSAAFELRKLGFDVTIFEAEEKRVGGRVYTYYFDQEKNLYGELGPSRIPASHEAVWHYYKLFGLPTRPFIQVNPNAFLYFKNVRSKNTPQNIMKYFYPIYNMTPQERMTPPPQLLEYALEGAIKSASPQERSQIINILQTYSPIVKYWDANSNRTMFQAMNLSEGAINLISSLVPVAGQYLYNSYIDMVEEYYPVNLTYLYEIPGGLSRLPYAFYNSLMHADPSAVYPGIPMDCLGKITWKGGHYITGISRYEKAGGIVLEYSRTGDVKPMYEAFDYVVCALPFSTLRNIQIHPLFSHTKMQAIKEVNYDASQKTITLFSRRFWEEGSPDERILGGISYTDLPVTAIFYPNDHMNPQSVNPQQPGVLTASYGSNLDATRLANQLPEVRLEEIQRELEEVHGLPRGWLAPIIEKSVTQNWNTYPWTRGAFAYFTPQQKMLFSYAMAVPEYDNRVFMAGEHISGTHRWQQGALKTGMEAANGVAYWAKRRKYE